MNSGNYILDKDGNPVPEPDVMKWARWFGETERHVAMTEIRGCRISTVFLGIDHRFLGDGPPILWETMVFGGEFDQLQERYSSLEDAKRGHDAIVGKVTRHYLPTVPAREMPPLTSYRKKRR